MLVQLDDHTTTMISGGENITLPDYCHGFNGIGVGALVFAATAFFGIFTGFCMGGGCCFVFTSFGQVQHTVESGGGCLGGYAGRIAIARSEGPNWHGLCATMCGSMLALGIGGSVLLGGKLLGYWDCGDGKLL